MIWVAVIAFAILCLILLWVIYKPCVEGMTQSDTVVIFKTHVWNDEIEEFVQKIRSEACDFYVLAHTETPLPLKDASIPVITITEKDILSTYESGFVSLWLSNHWNTMWFYHHYPNYQYYWTIEYDVRIVGDSSKIWSYPGTEDFVFPRGPNQDPNWAYKDDYFGDKLNDSNKWYGYLQLARYSNRFLEYVDKVFQTGENGQDEMMMFSLLKRAEPLGMRGSNEFLSQFIQDSWSADYRDSSKHRQLLLQADPNKLTIFHPVK